MLKRKLLKLLLNFLIRRAPKKSATEAPTLLVLSLLNRQKPLLQDGTPILRPDQKQQGVLPAAGEFQPVAELFSSKRVGTQIDPVNLGRLIPTGFPDVALSFGSMPLGPSRDVGEAPPLQGILSQ